MKTRFPRQKLVTAQANQLGAASSQDLDRLERAMAAQVDTSDIPERPALKRHGPIWNAVAAEMRRQGLSGHRLWKRARAFCPRLPESAVYEFLSDKRSVRVEYADAMLQALDIHLIGSRKRRAG
jgi:hypothetical protein